VTGFWTLLVVAGVVDWVAVGRSDHRLEYVAKPAVLAAFTTAAAILPASHTDLVDRRWWFVAVLVFCLVGDVLPMLPGDPFSGRPTHVSGPTRRSTPNPSSMARSGR
jgi:uncharacterized membrane protein YhhN